MERGFEEAIVDICHAGQHLSDVASGVVEAGCKQVVGARLKHAALRWTVAGANAIIALRGCRLSSRFEDLWERRTDRAA